MPTIANDSPARRTLIAAACGHDVLEELYLESWSVTTMRWSATHELEATYRDGENTLRIKRDVTAEQVRAIMAA